MDSKTTTVPCDAPGRMESVLVDVELSNHIDVTVVYANDEVGVRTSTAIGPPDFVGENVNVETTLPP